MSALYQKHDFESHFLALPLPARLLEMTWQVSHFFLRDNALAVVYDMHLIELPCFLVLVSDPAPGNHTQQGQTILPPNTSQPSVSPPQPVYPGSTVVAQNTVTVPVGSTSPPTSTQIHRTGRTSPSLASSDQPIIRRRTSLPTPTISYQLPENSITVPTSVGEQFLAPAHTSTPTPTPVVAPSQCGESEGETQGKSPGIEDILALDKKLRSLFHDQGSSSGSSAQPDASGDVAPASSPPNTISSPPPGLASTAGHGVPASLSLSSSGNFVPGLFASQSQGGPASVQTSLQTSQVDLGVPRLQVGTTVLFRGFTGVQFLVKHLFS